MSETTHTSTPSGAPQIFVYHDLHPEDGAMLQALYSRSPASVVTHLEKVKAAGSGKFMSQYYVGYGHASIGDCGVTTVFLENYSMLAAKAIQDNPLYSGQEASTRYLDFAQQPLYDPYQTPASMAILEGWMALYNSTMPLMKAALAERHPFNPEDYKSEKVWQNTLHARAFDILRGFLPVGCTTLFSWTTNLRQARDRLMQLKHHPLPEIQQLAQDLFKELYSKYPNSFTGEEMGSAERYAARDAYATVQSARDNFVTIADLQLSSSEIERVKAFEIVTRKNQIDIAGLNARESSALQTRPEGAHLSRRLAAYGNYNLYFLLDFGSYRDLQRHRNGTCQVPLIDGTFGIYPWYLQQVESLIGPEAFSTFKAEVTRLLAAIEALPLNSVQTNAMQNQYLYPMGMALLCHLGYSLPQMVYVAELRSMKTVHATLRPIAQQMGKILKEDFPTMALFIDTDADGWSAKRGTQTIEEKDKVA
jgi:thymidylate synthase ThyX